MAAGDMAAGAEAAGDNPLPDLSADRISPSPSPRLSVGMLAPGSIDFEVLPCRCINR
jgi:hypothetical protein